MISIIIPAHNEEHVIQHCLSGLLDGIESGEFEVIVVCNACSDRTAAVVLELSDKITCIEVDKASKTHALNIGDDIAQHFPRVYMDADVRMTSPDLTTMARALADGPLMAASPCMKMDMAHATWLVRAYYEIWGALPYCRAGMIGVGVYALSEEGRARFNEFPDIVADDGYIRLLFSSDERGVVPGAISVVRAPYNLCGLLKIKTRSRLGGYELRMKYPHLFEHDDKDYSSAISAMLGSWRLWPKVLAYLLVNLLSRARAKLHVRRIGFSGWERDESSRSHV